MLLRMFEDQYITEEELINAIIEGCKIQFYKPNFEIKAPHFVFWIKDLLEEQYGNSVKKGVIVKTTLDYEIQKQAEEILKNNQKNLAKYQANNSSMLYVDTDQGDILAYVGSLDYFNTDIQGQNDMVRSPRQSGSSIKPLLYAL
ncbi:hypothetical protein IJM86_05285 [bacterium]|nr:hypothetical protein [bacterium]